MSVGTEDNLDVDKLLFCFHFNFKDSKLMVLERKDYDEDMVLMQIIY